MKEPLLTDEARDDLAEIWATIAEARDERTSDRMNRKILAACRSKAEFPETRRMRDEILPGLRSLVVRSRVERRTLTVDAPGAVLSDRRRRSPWSDSRS